MAAGGVTGACAAGAGLPVRRTAAPRTPGWLHRDRSTGRDPVARWRWQIQPGVEECVPVVNLRWCQLLLLQRLQQDFTAPRRFGAQQYRTLVLLQESSQLVGGGCARCSLARIGRLSTGVSGAPAHRGCGAVPVRRSYPVLVQLLHRGKAAPGRQQGPPRVDAVFLETGVTSCQKCCAAPW